MTRPVEDDIAVGVLVILLVLAVFMGVLLVMVGR